MFVNFIVHARYICHLHYSIPGLFNQCLVFSFLIFWHLEFWILFLLLNNLFLHYTIHDLFQSWELFTILFNPFLREPALTGLWISHGFSHAVIQVIRVAFALFNVGKVTWIDKPWARRGSLCALSPFNNPLTRRIWCSELKHFVEVDGPASSDSELVLRFILQIFLVLHFYDTAGDAVIPFPYWFIVVGVSSFVPYPWLVEIIWCFCFEGLRFLH